MLTVTSSYKKVMIEVDGNFPLIWGGSENPDGVDRFIYDLEILRSCLWNWVQEIGEEEVAISIHRINRYMKWIKQASNVYLIKNNPVSKPVANAIVRNYSLLTTQDKELMGHMFDSWWIQTQAEILMEVTEK